VTAAPKWQAIEIELTPLAESFDRMTPRGQSMLPLPHAPCTPMGGPHVDVPKNSRSSLLVFRNWV
jgi:hypothetical protein